MLKKIGIIILIVVVVMLLTSINFNTDEKTRLDPKDLRFRIGKKKRF